MNKEQLTINLIDNIMSYFKYELLIKIEEKPNNFNIFNTVLNIMSIMNKYTYSYTLKDIDDKLFCELINEIKENL